MVFLSSVALKTDQPLIVGDWLPQRVDSTRFQIGAIFYLVMGTSPLPDTDTTSVLININCI